MNDQPQQAPRCIDLVELLTAYLDGALGDDVRRQFEEHLEGCEGCRAALAQWQSVAHLAAQLSAADIATLDSYVRHRFLTAVATLRRK